MYLNPPTYITLIFWSTVSCWFDIMICNKALKKHALLLANILDPFAHGLHADVSLFCFFFPTRNERCFQVPMSWKKWLECSTQSASYGCTWEVCQQQKKCKSPTWQQPSATLKLLLCLATYHTHPPPDGCTLHADHFLNTIVFNCNLPQLKGIIAE